MNQDHGVYCIRLFHIIEYRKIYLFLNLCDSMDKLVSLLSVWSLWWSQQSAQHQLFQLDERRFEGEREEERHKHGDEQAPKVEQGQQEPADLHSEGAAIKQVFINKFIYL